MSFDCELLSYSYDVQCTYDLIVTIKSFILDNKYTEPFPQSDVLSLTMNIESLQQSFPERSDQTKGKPLSQDTSDTITLLYLRSKEPMRIHKSRIPHSKDTIKCIPMYIHSQRNLSVCACDITNAVFN